MFDKVDPVAQSRKLAAALTAVVNGLDEPDSLNAPLSELGRRHASYGVEDAHYDAVGAALLWALEAALRSQWTQDLKTAWSEAYEIVGRTMRSAAGTNGPTSGGDGSDRQHRQTRSSQEEG
jgi:hemoglobin-like flavoprotein